MLERLVHGDAPVGPQREQRGHEVLGADGDVRPLGALQIVVRLLDLKGQQREVYEHILQDVHRYLITKLVAQSKKFSPFILHHITRSQGVHYLVEEVVLVEREGAAQQDVQHHPQAPHVCSRPVAPCARHCALAFQHLLYRCYSMLDSEVAQDGQTHCKPQERSTVEYRRRF